MAFRNGLHTIKHGQESEELELIDQEIRSHRKKIARRIICLAGILIVLFVAAELYLALRTFTSYTVNSSTERRDSDAVNFTNFGNNIIKYSNDGAECTDADDQQIWNQSYEMTTPTLAKSSKYLAIYDKNGIDVYIMSSSAAEAHLEMSNSIVSLAVSDQGSVAVLMKDQTTTIVALYNIDGDKIAGGEYYEENGDFPVDVALSYDAKKMAISTVNVSQGSLKSLITFYNFGSVGKNEVDNKVGEYEYDDTLIPEVEFVSDDRMVALANDRVLFFEGSEKPEPTEEIVPDSQMKSVIYNSKYVGVVTENSGEDGGYHLCLYNTKGKSTMDVDTDINYTDIYFLENGEVCLTDGLRLEIYTTHSIKKFTYEFDQEIVHVLSQGKGAEYIFIFEDSTQEVRLK